MELLEGVADDFLAFELLEDDGRAFRAGQIARSALDTLNADC